MTIDERIERLTERHEALAQSGELTNHAVNDLAQSVELTRHAVNDLANHLDRLISTVETLAAVTASHAERLNRLEGV